MRASTLLERLKQRKIVQWALAYTAGSVALYSALEAFAEPWGVGDLQLRITQVLLLAGFFLALTLAWYHGERGEQRVTGIELLILAGIMGLGAMGLRLVTSGVAPRPLGPASSMEYRLSVRLPDDQALGGRGTFDVSPDGAFMVYEGPGADGESQLWIRRWALLDATPIAQTAGARAPAVSPSGTEVAFYRNDSLLVVHLGTGATRTAASRTGAGSPRWSADSRWLYWGNTEGAYRTPSRRGPVDTLVTGLNVWHAEPLPGGIGMVYAVLRGGEDFRIDALDFRSGETTVLVEDADSWHPRWWNGHLLLASGLALVARRFDARRLALEGGEVTLATGLAAGVSVGAPTQPFSVSRSGVVVFPSAPPSRQQIVWVDRDATMVPVDTGWAFDAGGPSAGFTLSPDGSRIAYRERTGGTEGNNNIWVKPVDGGPPRQVTFHEAEDRLPRWSADGSRLLFLSDRDDDGNQVWSVPVDGSERPRRIVTHSAGINEVLEDPSGTGALIVRVGGSADFPNRDLLVARPGADPEFEALAASEAGERAASWSPDGRWLAYQSDHEGRPEIYVVPFPLDGSGGRRISGSGGIKPSWSPQGDELFYWRGTELVAVEVDLQPTFTFGRESVVLEDPTGLRAMISAGRDFYGVAPDAERFLMIRNAQETQEPELVLLLGLEAAIARLAPG